jgi:hypothetical protein
MFKPKLIMLSVAALLAVSAIPALARKVHHKPLVTRSHHTSLVSGKRVHRSLTTKHHRSSLLAAKSLKGHRSLTHRGIHRSALSSTSHFHVHVTKMPPTIDGIRS